jgi:zinc protease
MAGSVRAFLFLLFSAAVLSAQNGLPEAAAPRPFKVPEVSESKLANGLTVATVRRSNVPLVTVRLLIRAGAEAEPSSLAGLADLTAALSAKRTRTRNADQIAEQMEFLGGVLEAGADWNKSAFTFTVATDKLDAALLVLRDVVLNATSDANELELIRSQALDNLAADLKEPSFLASYAASRFSFGEHPPGGTPQSLKAVRRSDIVRFRAAHYKPENSVLIFTGDIDAARAKSLALRTLGAWRPAPRRTVRGQAGIPAATNGSAPERNGRILVVDLPDSGQSAVIYAKDTGTGRVTCLLPLRCDSRREFFHASVANSILGGGYSSRLNQEIRIRRGLSYGAGSGIAWRGWSAKFSARAQTKDESAAEVAQIFVDEVGRLAAEEASDSELAPRKLVIIGDYGREFETTAETAETVSAIYAYYVSPAEMGSFADRINAVPATEVREFAGRFLQGGDIVIAGDYRKFRDDLERRFPNAELTVVMASNLELSIEAYLK